MYTYNTKGVCSEKITFDIIDGKVFNVHIIKGCTGNTKGVSNLVEGMDAKEVVKRLKGIKCRNNTSCPDQLACAIEQALSENK